MIDDRAESPPARRVGRPRWLDVRLVVGLVLVLVAVVVGTRVVGAASRGDLVWAASRELAAGTTLTTDDLEAVTVRLAGSSSAYLDAGAPPPSGYVLVRDVGPGELLPAAALAPASSSSDRRLVSVPVDAHHFPAGLTRGQRVDVYVVQAAAPGQSGTAEPSLVLEDATVAQASGGGGAFGGAGAAATGFVLEVGADDVAAVVGAVGSGTIQLVRVPDPPVGDGS